ncbi:MAG: DegT/DnrJ/EryC1/StrS family aminotransferase, partial [Pseudomonadota bacterium]
RQRSGHHLYLVDIDYSSAGPDRKTVMERLRARRIGTQVHYIPVHHHPWHRERMGLGEGAMPVSERYYAGCLSIPCFPDLEDHEVDRVAHALREVLDA